MPPRRISFAAKASLLQMPAHLVRQFCKLSPPRKNPPPNSHVTPRPQTLLLVSQRYDRLDPHRSPRRQPGGDNRHEHSRHRRAKVDSRIHRRYLECTVTDGTFPMHRIRTPLSPFKLPLYLPGHSQKNHPGGNIPSVTICRLFRMSRHFGEISINTKKFSNWRHFDVFRVPQMDSNWSDGPGSR